MLNFPLLLRRWASAQQEFNVARLAQLAHIFAAKTLPNLLSTSGELMAISSTFENDRARLLGRQGDSLFNDHREIRRTRRG